jgi:cytochrome P450
VAAHRSRREGFALARLAELDVPYYVPEDTFDLVSGHTDLQAARAAGHWIVRTPLWYSVIDDTAARELRTHPHLHSVGTRFLEALGIDDGPYYEFARQALPALEGPEHSRIRRTISAAFTPRSIERLRPSMRRFISDRAEEIVARGHCEFMADIARHYPVSVLCELLGVSASDWGLFHQWARDMLPDPWYEAATRLASMNQAVTEFTAYVDALIDYRWREPAEDLLSALLHTHVRDGQLTRDELARVAISIVMGGTEAIRYQLGLGMHVLAQRPTDWARLVDDPARVAPAVEEILRYAPTVMGAGRIAVDDFEYRGVTIEEHTILFLLHAAANRDPAAVSCPMAFDIDAPRGRWQSHTFGSGAHYCLGANLARVELQEAFAVLARTWASVEIDEPPTMRPVHLLWGPESLSLRVEGRGHRSRPPTALSRSAEIGAPAAAHP